MINATRGISFPYIVRMAIVVATTCVVSPQSTNGTELEEIITFLDALDDRGDALWVKYRIDELYTSKYMSVYNSQARRHSPSVADFTFPVICDLAVKGDKRRTSHIGPDVTPSGLGKLRDPFVHVYDGTRTLRYDNARSPHGGPLYEVSTQASNVDISYPTPWELIQHNHLLEALRVLSDPNVSEEFAGSVAMTSVKDDRISGDAVKLVITWSKGDVEEYILAPSEFYAIYSVTIRHKSVKTVKTVTDVVYTKDHDAVIPSLATYSIFNSEGVLLRQSKLSVTSTTTLHSEIPDDLFTINLPADAHLYDMDTKTLLRDPSLIQRRLDRIETSFSTSWIPVIVIGNILFFSLLLIALYISKKRW